MMHWLTDTGTLTMQGWQWIALTATMTAVGGITGTIGRWLGHRAGRKIHERITQ